MTLENMHNIETRSNIEMPSNKVEGSKSDEYLRSILDDVKNLNPDKIESILNKNMEGSDTKFENIERNKTIEGLSDADKARIKEETGWSNKILDNIRNPEEADIYRNLNLSESIINGKECLIRSDIDWNQKDADGQTNLERAKSGKAPYNKDGERVTLHHIGQHNDSPLAELTHSEHVGKNNHILHDLTKKSEINRNEFSNSKKSYWWLRASAQGEIA